MKIIPSNQTLILANERGGSGGLPTAPSSRALYHVGSETVLSRVTMVATRPDDTLVYIQADYSSMAHAVGHVDPSTSAPTDKALASLTRLPARVAREEDSGAPNHSSRGIALYASTQRMLAEAPTTQIDVRA